MGERERKKEREGDAQGCHRVAVLLLYAVCCCFGSSESGMNSIEAREGLVIIHPLRHSLKGAQQHLICYFLGHTDNTQTE